MKLAVISDIHGNLQALESVLSDADQQSVTEYISLGDMTGYGAQPAEVLDLLGSRKVISVMGNHEAALFDEAVLDSMNTNARLSALITRSLLSPEQMNYLKGLPRFIKTGNLHFVHGMPPDSFLEYMLFQPEHRIRELFRQNDMWICFVGHTHLSRLYTIHDDRVTPRLLEPGAISLEHSRRYLVNVGSVGQPRNRDPRARYVILNDEDMTLTLCAVDYDIGKAARMIRERGFPENNAERLFRGG